MQQYCSLGRHSYDDGVKIKQPSSREEALLRITNREQLACSECRGKFTENIDKIKMYQNKLNSIEVEYKKLNMSPEKIKEISITIKIIDGKLLFDDSNSDNRYIVDDH